MDAKKKTLRRLENMLKDDPNIFDDDPEMLELLSKLREETERSDPKAVTRPKRNERDSVSREAEAVLAFFDKSSHFVRLKCKGCKKDFASTYGCVAYCTDHCRAKALKEIGIEWDWSKGSDERWRPSWYNEISQKRDESSVEFSVRLERIHGYYPTPLVVPGSVLEWLTATAPAQNQESEPPTLVQVELAG